MKQLLIIILTLFIVCNSALAQQTAPAIQWQNAIGGDHAGYVNRMTPTNDGGYIVVGWVDSTNNLGVTNYHKNNDAWVAKLDATCNIVWQQCYGGSDDEWAYNVEQTKDGGYIIGALTDSKDGDVKINKGGADIWIFKIDENGKFLWQRTLGGSGFDMVNSLHQTKEGGYIIAGSTESDDGDVMGFHFVWPNLNPDGWVIKIDSIGKIDWQKCLGGTNSDAMFDIIQNGDGSYIVAGASSSFDGDVSGNHGGADGWIVKLSDKGDIIWQQCYGGSDIDYYNKVKQTKDGGYILGGGTTSNNLEVSGNHGQEDMWVVRIDSIGGLIWQRCFGGSDLESLHDLTTTLDNGFIFCGVTRSNDGDIKGFHGYSDYWVVFIDSTGKIEWQRCLGGVYAGQAYNIFQTTDGGFIIGGLSGAQVGDGDVTVHYNMDSSSVSTDWWVVKLAFAPHAIQVNYFNNQLLLFPNPAHNFIGIQSDNIKEIKILDAAGKLYMHEKINTASNIYSYFNIQYLAKGVYIVQAAGNDGSIKVGKLMVE